MAICPLPPDVVALMAAGEVIDSPAAVVRELVENALDAGATRITVAIQPQPWQIQVTDNGAGLALADLKLAAAAHSTSKWRGAAAGLAPQDWQIQTLGFRGEALHSLCQLAQVTLCSCPQGGEEPGYRVVYDSQGEPQALDPIAMAPGTQVTVANLFGPWQPRQQAGPSPRQQQGVIRRGIAALALAHPGVTWQGFWGDRPWFTFWPGASALEQLPQVMGRLQPGDLRRQRQRVALPQGEGWLDLVLGLPDRCHRPRPDGVWIALNHRPVAIPEVEAAIAQGLRRSLPKDRHPIAALHLQAPWDQVDWHRSADKSQVYLHHGDHWCQAIAAALTTTLTLTGLPTADSEARWQQLLPLREGDTPYGVTPPAAADPPMLKAIAQVHNRYILAEHPAGLCLVEQHIAHERVLYEALQDHWQLVPLPAPLVLAGLSPDQCQQLERIGIPVEPFGPDLWTVRHAPAPLAERPDCAEALRELSQGQDLDSALVATACRTAIRNGTPLPLDTLADLLAAWQRTRHPQTCPHGRPICLTLKESSLARYFRRHWVIGKSHGLEGGINLGAIDHQGIAPQTVPLAGTEIQGGGGD